MTSPIEPADHDLQFNTSEPAVNAAGATVATCARCKQPIGDEYYAIGNHPLCAACRDILQPGARGRRPMRLAKAIGLGTAAALLGAVIWYGVRIIANMEIGLIAILVGFLVGKAVRIGSGNRGGRAYQVIAVLLTYCGIAANYMPDVTQALLAGAHDRAATQPASDGTPAAIHSAATKAGEAAPATTAPAAAPHQRPSLPKLAAAVVLLVALVFAVSLAAPFLAGTQNIIGLLIIGFALWQAWKLNRRFALPITGPYRLGGASPAGPVGSLA
ncbi:MAG: hypothetical protein JWM57_716 [Phycisphaerales bacterium]|nr:hypothetical protein [Phycisphaerales bacterium]